MIIDDPFTHRVTQNYLKDPLFHRLISHKFKNLPANKQLELYNKFDLLPQINLTLNDIIEISENIDLMSIESLIVEISSIIRWILENQDKEEGCWKLLSKDEVEEFREIEFENIDSYEDDAIPNAWTNSILSLILMKWYKLINKNKILSLCSSGKCKSIYKNFEFNKNEISLSIEKSKKWLYNNRNESLGLKAWGPLIPDIKKGLINTYDTSFAYIGMNFLKNKKKRSAAKYNKSQMPDEIRLLIGDNSPFFDKKLCAWRPEERTSLDTGATAYALTALMKHNDITGFLVMPTEMVQKGINWLIQNQDTETGGWGNLKGKATRIDRTCLTLMALIRFKNSSSKNYVPYEVLDRGIKYLSNKMRKVNYCNKKSDYYIFCWPKDDKNEDEDLCFKNTSLAISTLLRYGMPTTTYEVQKGVVGLLRIHKYRCKNPHEFENPIIHKLDEAYFWCMLLDYLKSCLQDVEINF